jgi:hypothetical protein
LQTNSPKPFVRNSIYPFIKQEKRDGNVNVLSTRDHCYVRLRRLADCDHPVRRRCRVSGAAYDAKPQSLTTGSKMKKPTLKVQERTQPRNIQRADIAPPDGYALVIDGHFKSQFVEAKPAKKAATELLAKYPMLQVEIYDATSKSRSRVE